MVWQATIGVYGWEAVGKPIVDAYHGQPVMDKFRLGTLSMVLGTLAAAITPIPYKVFTISSGVFIPVRLFRGRLGDRKAFQFFLVAALIGWTSIKSGLRRALTSLCPCLILLIAGFATVACCVDSQEFIRIGDQRATSSQVRQPVVPEVGSKKKPRRRRQNLASVIEGETLAHRASCRVTSDDQNQRNQ